MSIVVPSYYKKFRCIAGECRHSCCIGWEIDIDKDTLEYYKCIKGEFGKRLEKCIAEDGENSYFALSENERCPFLNKDGLCDIILELGEDSLCDICAEHPRFINYYSSHEELGIGLCCEEAAKIILSGTEPFSTILYESENTPEYDEREAYYFDLRAHIFSVVQNRGITIKERFLILCEEFGINFNDFSCRRTVPIYLSLERLDESWTDILQMLVSSDMSLLEKQDFQVPFEQLFCYFIYRYFCEAVFDEKPVNRIRFALSSCILIAVICGNHIIKNGGITFDDVVEYARMYSSEVEYSEENISQIFYLI